MKIFAILLYWPPLWVSIIFLYKQTIRLYDKSSFKCYPEETLEFFQCFLIFIQMSDYSFVLLFLKRESHPKQTFLSARDWRSCKNDWYLLGQYNFSLQSDHSSLLWQIIFTRLKIRQKLLLFFHSHFCALFFCVALSQKQCDSHFKLSYIQNRNYYRHSFNSK